MDAGSWSGMTGAARQVGEYGFCTFLSLAIR
jgi:hypothetical protein